MWIIFCVLAVLVVAYLYMCKPYTKRKAEVIARFGGMIAHRGLFDNDSESPENSISAFMLAIDSGFGVELDVRLTSDDVLVVFHDHNLLRSCGVSKRVCDMTYAELSEYTLFNSEQRVPTFTEVLSLIDGRVPIICEVKSESRHCDAVCRETARQIGEYNGEVCIESFNPAVLRWFFVNRPNILRGQLASGVFGYVKGIPLYGRLIFANCLMNHWAKPDFIAYNHKYRSKLTVMIMRKMYGCAMAAYTIKSELEERTAMLHFDTLIFDGYLPKES